MEGRRFLYSMFGPELSQLSYVEVIWLDKDQATGALILLGSLAGIGIYVWVLIFYTTIILQLTAFVAVASILGIIAWIGWTMASTPPPEPIDTQGLTGISETETATSTATTSPTVAKPADPPEKQQ